MGAIWLALRLIGAAVGVITLLAYATDYLRIDFKPAFAEFLRQLEGLVLDVPLQWVEAWVIGPVLEWMSSYFGWSLKYPAEHWRPVFTLTWLWFLSISRSGAGLFTFGNSASVVVWALICALVSAVVAGAAKLDEFAFIAPLIAFFFFYLGICLFRLRFRIMLFCFLVIAIVAATGHYAPTTIGLHRHLTGAEFEAVRGLVSLTAGVGVLGLLFLSLGLLMAPKEARTRPSNLFEDEDAGPLVATGLDIVGTMGLALAIGYVMMK